MTTPRWVRPPLGSVFGSVIAMPTPQLRFAAARDPIDAHCAPAYCVATFDVPHPSIVRAAVRSYFTFVRLAFSSSRLASPMFPGASKMRAGVTTAIRSSASWIWPAVPAI